MYFYMSLISIKLFFIFNIMIFINYYGGRPKNMLSAYLFGNLRGVLTILVYDDVSVSETKKAIILRQELLTYSLRSQ